MTLQFLNLHSTSIVKHLFNRTLKGDGEKALGDELYCKEPSCTVSSVSATVRLITLSPLWPLYVEICQARKNRYSIAIS